jgi:hypothetical protein
MTESPLCEFFSFCPRLGATKRPLSEFPSCACFHRDGKSTLPWVPPCSPLKSKHRILSHYVCNKQESASVPCWAMNMLPFWIQVLHWDRIVKFHYSIFVVKIYFQYSKVTHRLGKTTRKMQQKGVDDDDNQQVPGSVSVQLLISEQWFDT